MAHLRYVTKGVCSRAIHVEIENNIITDVRFEGGCAGNTQGIANLIKGMDANDAVSRLEGIRCGFKSTSCPDQLAKAIRLIQEQ